jgi:flagellar assembly protein FliH
MKPIGGALYETHWWGRKVMAKAVFRPGELSEVATRVVLEPPHLLELSHLLPSAEEQTEEEKEEEYTGPTAEDLRREAEAFKEQWESEKEGMISAARAEAERIIREAQESAAEDLERKTGEAQALKQGAEEESARLLADSSAKAQAITDSAQTAFDEERRKVLEEGRTEGREAGYQDGKAEVDRLIGRTHTVLERAQAQREEILLETEQQIIDLVLLIARKVIKIISEGQRTVILSNISAALRKIKTKGTVIIRVNLADLQLGTEHIKDFTKLVESAASIQLMEDSSVDPGGCIVETEFGEIDARISSQLTELENKILEISPIKQVRKTLPAGKAG